MDRAESSIPNEPGEGGGRLWEVFRALVSQPGSLIDKHRHSVFSHLIAQLRALCPVEVVFSDDDVGRDVAVRAGIPGISRALQVLVNPLALLSFVGLAIVGMRTDVLPSWAGWVVVIWSGLFVFFPLPLAIAPIALFFGIVLLVTG